MMRLVLLSALLTSASAYYRAAVDVGGDVVAGAGNLTGGGKIGTYTVLLQVLNPAYGDLKLLLECCGDARHYASEIASKINLNMFDGDQEKSIRAQYVGDGKCKATGPVESIAKKGDSKCSYLYSFANKDWKSYQYTAQCVPSDVCAVDVVGATKGLKVAYPVVIQILNRNAGDMAYAGFGPTSSCLEGMNQVNMANVHFKKEEIFINVFGKKLPTGFKERMHVEGMRQLNVREMFSKCENTSATGILYVFKNKFWRDPQHAMNITDFDLELEMARRKKDLDELMNYKLPEPTKKGEEPKAPEPKAEKPQGLDLAKAIGTLGANVGSTLEKEKSSKVEDIQDDLDQVEKKLEEKQEAAKEKLEEEKKKLEEYEVEKAKAAKVEVPEAPKPPKAPKAPEVPELPKVEVPEAPKPPKAPKAPEVPELPKVEVPEVPKPPKAPKAPEVPELPKAPKAPEVPEVPELPKVEVPEGVPATPVVQDLPKAEVPEVPPASEEREEATKKAPVSSAEKAAEIAKREREQISQEVLFPWEVRKNSDEEKPAPKEVSARRMQDQHRPS
ncbi:unnamed protein product [Cladocopium goreaui]|uniref:Geranylgeranyl diphosphate reductase, chloroplastic n=1 Tax=Cladocopium goreaui TaxID=2562237 RepID=A0A9P1DXD0_9DINO|nr:unnamed protein product [Cladocopium goreaui]